MDAAERRATVLKTVVEEYVRTAAPVASQTVTDARDLGVSSATVRNDMTQLEREGYLTQPHTSAGRIPTDQGYRYFVDHFSAARSLPVGQRRAVSSSSPPPIGHSRTCSIRPACCSPGSRATRQ